MTLSTKALPGAIQSFEDFVERALSFDHYTDMSDDHGVYLAGRRRREIMDKYAGENELAGKLWNKMCKNNLEGFMAGQLITRVEGAVFNKAQKAGINELCDFIPYLASSGKDTMLGGSVRDAIAKHVGAPPSWSYDPEEMEARQSMIDDWIKNYKSKAR